MWSCEFTKFTIVFQGVGLCLAASCYAASWYIILWRPRVLFFVKPPSFLKKNDAKFLNDVRDRHLLVHGHHLVNWFHLHQRTAILTSATRAFLAQNVAENATGGEERKSKSHCGVWNRREGWRDFNPSFEMNEASGLGRLPERQYMGKWWQNYTDSSNLVFDWDTKNLSLTDWVGWVVHFG